MAMASASAALASEHPSSSNPPGKHEAKTDSPKAKNTRGGKDTPYPPEDGFSRVVYLMYGEEKCEDNIIRSIRTAALASKADKEDRRKGMSGMSGGRVLLYYKYVSVDKPEELRIWQMQLCSVLDLRGRIHVGTEGINGTVGGTLESTQLYIDAMNQHHRWGKLFSGIDFKSSEGGRQCFPNLFVRVCTEICQMNCNPEEISWKNGARHLSPREFHELYAKTILPLSANPSSSIPLDSHSDMDHTSSIEMLPRASAVDKLSSAVILDVRNYYESAIGRFKNAVRIQTRTFSEFPEVADQLIEDLDLKNKTHVLMYCTGGIRCERASAYLKSRGVMSCYQLQGGIHRYCEQIEDSKSFFRGRNFVFDRRLSTRRVGQPVIAANSSDDKSGKSLDFGLTAAKKEHIRSVIGECVVCEQQPWDTYDNQITCEKCSALVLVCSSCRSNLNKTKMKKSSHKRSLHHEYKLLCECCKNNDKSTV